MVLALPLLRLEDFLFRQMLLLGHAVYQGLLELQVIPAPLIFLEMPQLEIYGRTTIATRGQQAQREISFCPTPYNHEVH